MMKGPIVLIVAATAACGGRAGVTPLTVEATRVDTIAISAMARELSSDAMRGRGPWTKENELVAQRLAGELTRLGGRPVIGQSILVPFVQGDRKSVV